VRPSRPRCGRWSTRWCSCILPARAEHDIPCCDIHDAAEVPPSASWVSLERFVMRTTYWRSVAAQFRAGGSRCQLRVADTASRLRSVVRRVRADSHIRMRLENFVTSRNSVSHISAPVCNRSPLWCGVAGRYACRMGRFWHRTTGWFVGSHSACAARTVRGNLVLCAARLSGSMQTAGRTPPRFGQPRSHVVLAKLA
jgi:hypothetical protein